MIPLKPKNKKWAKFQYTVYRRVKNWCEKVGIDTDNIEFAPIKEGEKGSKRPDIILNIKRGPKEPNFSYYVSHLTLNGALEDFVDFFVQENKKMTYTVVIDATILDFDSLKPWGKKFKQMKEYRAILEKDECCVACFSVVVHPYGWDHSLNHGIENDIHIITLNHLKDFLDTIYLSTNFLEPEKWISKIFTSKYDECPSCGNNQLIFDAIFYCPEFSNPLVEETIENFTTLVETDDYKPPVEEQTLCWTCPRSAYCDGLIKTFDVFCKKCGWTESSDILHPCSLALLNDGYSDDCLDCSEPHECKAYKKLKDLGVVY